MLFLEEEELAYRLPKFKISACEYDAPITFLGGSTAGVSLFLRELLEEFVRQKEVAVLVEVRVSHQDWKCIVPRQDVHLTRFDL